MKICIVDIETLGLDPRHSIIEFGLMIEDTNNPLPRDQIPQLRFLVGNEDEVFGSIEGIRMHEKSGLWNEWCNSPKIDPRNLEICHFLEKHNFDFNKPVTFGGKNFVGFDKVRLNLQAPSWSRNFRISHRTVDISTLFLDPTKDDELPSLKTCLERSNIETPVSHFALDDCWSVIQCLRFKFSQLKTVI